ncbi:MAG TPA: oxalate/formate MFS antiporter [Vicinamibacterales bacterium]|nr:oxalate/formate MFS antiporter [Vicinamibacterales bacterium]
MKINNRWFQLVASLIAMIMIANFQYAWTLFVEPMRQGTGWKLSEIQYAFTLFILFQTWVQPCQGFLIDRLGPRIFATIAGVLCMIGWGGLGYATSLPMLYVLYVTAGVGAALIYGGCMGSSLKWFSTKERGFAAGLTAAGYGAGAALFIPFIASTIKNTGYQSAFLYTGIIQGTIIIVVAQFLRHPPVQAVAKAVASPSASLGQHQFSTSEMVRTPQFYVLYAMFVMMATGGLLVTANTSPIGKAWGIPASAVAFAVSFNAIANGASRFFWGWVSDRTGREMAMGIAFTLQAFCLLALLTFGRTSPTLFTVTLIAVFFTWGETFSLFPSLTADYFGTKSATANYGVMYSAKGVSSIIGGGVAALLFERFGTWNACLYGSAALAAIAAAIAFSLYASKSAVTAPMGIPVTAK